MSYAERAVMHISRPVHDRLTAIKNDQQAQLKRQVTYSEVIEQLLNYQWKAAEARWSATEGCDD